MKKKKNKINVIKYFGGKGLFKIHSKKNYPLISIIMPNYKSKSLKKAIMSVLNQSYKNIELIVIDGDSGKSATNILKKLNNKINFWVSEKDRGMWDAWNKGFKLSKGDYVGVVDSSNILYKNAIKTLSKYIKRYPNIDFFCGTIKKEGKIIGGYNPKEIYKKLNIIPSSVVGFYIKKKSLEKVGYLNLKYKIQADYDLLYRMIVKKKLKGMHTSGREVFGNLGNSGFSKKHNFYKKLFNELQIRIDNNQNFFILIYILIGRTLMHFFNKI